MSFAPVSGEGSGVIRVCGRAALVAHRRLSARLKVTTVEHPDPPFYCENDVETAAKKRCGQQCAACERQVDVAESTPARWPSKE